MEQRFAFTKQFTRFAAAGLIFTVMVVAGCRMKSSQPTDQQLTSDIQSKIKGESALANQNIQVSVANGVATLNGTVSDDASRALAAMTAEPCPV